PGCMHREMDVSPDFTFGVQQNDIPVPLGFQFDKDRSEAYSYIKYSSTGVGSFRSWKGFYFGDTQVGNLVPWFKSQMAVDGWRYKTTQEELMRKGLQFSKADETASIWLYREFDSRFE